MKILEFIESEFSENSVIFEIGCHMGIDTKKIIQASRSKNMHCFECDPRNIEVLKEQNLDAIVNNTAVSNIDGYVELYQSTGNPGVYFGDDLLDSNDWTASSSIKKPKEHLRETPWCKFKDPIKVKSSRIDTYCGKNDIGEIDFVWMDVQGAEREVILGFGEMMKKTRYIYTEYSDTELYEDGMMPKNILMKLLGDEWTIIYDFGTDVLLKNTKY